MRSMNPYLRAALDWIQQRYPGKEPSPRLLRAWAQQYREAAQAMEDEARRRAGASPETFDFD